MLRQAGSRSRELWLMGARGFRTSAVAQGCKTEGNSVAAMIKAVNETSGSKLTSSLGELKAKLGAHYPAAEEAKGLSLQAKLATFGVLTWFLYRADQQARAHEWIVDLSLNVLQAAWLVSFASFLPFRSIFVALRGAAPHTSTPFNGLKAAASLKP